MTSWQVFVRYMRAYRDAWIEHVVVFVVLAVLAYAVT